LLEPLPAVEPPTPRVLSELLPLVPPAALPPVPRVVLVEPSPAVEPPVPSVELVWARAIAAVPASSVVASAVILKLFHMHLLLRLRHRRSVDPPDRPQNAKFFQTEWGARRQSWRHCAITNQT